MDLSFSVEMVELRKHINFVRAGLGSSKTDLPVLLMRFDVTGNKVAVFVASKEMFCRTEMKVIGERDGSFAVLGAKVERLISQVEAESVTFRADGENLEVRAGFLTVNFELYDGAVLKTIEQGLVEHLTAEGTAISRSAFEEALVCGRSCTTMNSIRPDVNHVEMRGGSMLSSDGRKILIYQHDGFADTLNFKAPASILNNLVTAVKNMEAENVQVIDGKSYYFVKGSATPGRLNEYSLGVRKVERSFPAVEGQIVKTEGATDEVSIDKHVLENMLKGVALGLASEEVKVQVELSGVLKEAVLEVSAINSVGRKSHERATCGRKASAPVSFPVSYKHLLDTVGVFKGDSVVDMLVLEKRNILLVRDKTEAREVLTVIPFRTERQIAEEKKEATSETKKVVKEIPTEAETQLVDVELETAAELD